MTSIKPIFDIVADECVTDADYPPIDNSPYTPEEWLRDAADYLLPTDVKASEDFRKLLADAEWLRAYLAEGGKSDILSIRYTAKLAKIGLAVMDNFAASPITAGQLGVQE